MPPLPPRGGVFVLSGVVRHLHRVPAGRLGGHGSLPTINPVNRPTKKPAIKTTTVKSAHQSVINSVICAALGRRAQYGKVVIRDRLPARARLQFIAHVFAPSAASRGSSTCPHRSRLTILETVALYTPNKRPISVVVTPPFP